jgi:hypothetical protein
VPFLIAACAACGGGGGGGTGNNPGDHQQLTGSGPWIVNGDVNAIAVGADGTTYLGGAFTRVGPVVGGWVALDPGTAGKAFDSALVDGPVSAAVDDGAGGLFIGGSFTQVDGVPRKGLAHLKADHTLDLAWDVPVQTWSSYSGQWLQGQVDVLHRSGTTLYVGGVFTRLGGQTRSNLGAVDGSGNVIATIPEADGEVFGIVQLGNVVYVGGRFANLGASPRNLLGAFSATTGAVSPDWIPALSLSVYPQLLQLGGLTGYVDTIYVAGYFDAVNGVTRRNLAAIDTSGFATAWQPDPDLPFWLTSARFAVATSFHAGIDTRVLYVSGPFQHVYNDAHDAVLSRNGIASWDLRFRDDPRISDWDPHLAPTGGVSIASIAPVLDPAGASTVYLSGSFTSAGGEPHAGIVAVGVGAAAAPRAWAPAGPRAATLLADHGTIWASGPTPGTVVRNRLAAIAPDGSLSAWDPDADGSVLALAVKGSTVYAGGSFTHVHGGARGRLAAIDGATGMPTAWSPPAPDAVVRALALDGDTVIAGGDFYNVGATPRGHVAFFDASGGLTSRDLGIFTFNPTSRVHALLVADGHLYVGGRFNGAAGIPANRTYPNVLAFDADGVVSTWWPCPSLTEPVTALARAPSGAIFLGGSFKDLGACQYHVPGVTRSRVAAFEPAGVGTQVPLPFRVGYELLIEPSATERRSVDAIAFDGNTVYLGGKYLGTSYNVPEHNLQAFDATAVTTAAPIWSGSDPAGQVRALAIQGGKVKAGGAFTATVGGKPLAGYMEVPK